MTASFRNLACAVYSDLFPPLWALLGPLLEELPTLRTVDAACTAKALYAAFTDTIPLPKVELKLPDYPWPLIWVRIWRPCLPHKETELGFFLIFTTSCWYLVCFRSTEAAALGVIFLGQAGGHLFGPLAEFPIWTPK